MLRCAAREAGQVKRWSNILWVDMVNKQREDKQDTAGSTIIYEAIGTNGLKDNTNLECPAEQMINEYNYTRREETEDDYI